MRTPKRMIRTASDREAVERGWFFDPKAADRAVEFFSRFLRHSKGVRAGKPFELLDWQRDELIRPLFGWRRPDGTRRFRRGLVFIAKKNGKSALASGIGLYLFAADRELGANVYVAATDRDQAGIIFDEAAAMVEQAPAALRRRVRLLKSRRRMLIDETHSTFRALSAETASQEGHDAHAVIFDELHAQSSRSLWDTLRFAGAARRQPLLLALTTAGDEEDSVCREQYDLAKAILAGEHVDPSFLAVVYEAGEELDWDSPAAAKAANPSLGHTLNVETFEEDRAEASRSPLAKAAFERYRLNRWRKATARWIEPIWLEQLTQTELALDDLAGEDVWVGLDLSSVSDLTAAAIVAARRAPDPEPACTSNDDGDHEQQEPNRPSVELEIRAVVQCFMPAATLEQAHPSVPYRAWADAGWLTLTAGPTTDFDSIFAYLDRAFRIARVEEVGIDPWQAQHLGNELAGAGMTVVEVRQGLRTMTAPIKAVEAAIRNDRLDFGGNPIVRWALLNSEVASDEQDNRKIVKPKTWRKVDPVVAMLMGVSRALLSPTLGGSVYAEREVEWF